MDEEKKQAPIISLRDRLLSTGIFVSKNGFSISLQRAYHRKDSQEMFRETIHLYEDDLLKVAELLRETYSACRESRALLKKNKNANENANANNSEEGSF